MAVTISRVLEGGALTLKRAESSNSQPTGRVLVVSGEACLWLLWLLYGAEHVTCPDDMHADDDDRMICRLSRYGKKAGYNNIYVVAKGTYVPRQLKDALTGTDYVSLLCSRVKSLVYFAFAVCLYYTRSDYILIDAPRRRQMSSWMCSGIQPQ